MESIMEIPVSEKIDDVPEPPQQPEVQYPVTCCAYLSKSNPVIWTDCITKGYTEYKCSIQVNESCIINGTSEYVSLVSQVVGDSLTPGMEVSNKYKYLSYDESNCTYVIKNCCVYEFDTSNCNLYTGRCLQGDEFSGYTYDESTCSFSNESSVCKYTYVVPKYEDDNNQNLYLRYDISNKKFVCATGINIYLYNPFDGYKCVGTGKLTKDSINYSLTPPSGSCIYYNPKSCSWQETSISTSPYQAIYVAQCDSISTSNEFTGHLICIVCHEGSWDSDTYKDNIAYTKLALPSTSISIAEFDFYQLCGKVEGTTFTPTTWCIICKKTNST